jgi:hypothetical protein
MLGSYETGRGTFVAMISRLTLAGFLAISAARGSTIVFSNLTGNIGDGGEGICGTASVCVRGQAVAAEFTPTGTYMLTDAAVVVGNIVGVGAAQTFNVWLAQDSGGVPGSFIEQIGFGVSASGFGGEVTANSIATPITLMSSTSYWLVLTPASTSTYIYWDVGGSSLVQYAVTVDATGASGWFSGGNHDGSQIEIDGTAVPEPGTVGFFLCGLAALFGYRNLRRSPR